MTETNEEVQIYHDNFYMHFDKKWQSTPRVQLCCASCLVYIPKRPNMWRQKLANPVGLPAPSSAPVCSLQFLESVALPHQDAPCGACVLPDMCLKSQGVLGLLDMCQKSPGLEGCQLPPQTSTVAGLPALSNIAGITRLTDAPKAVGFPDVCQVPHFVCNRQGLF